MRLWLALAAALLAGCGPAVLAVPKAKDAAARPSDIPDAPGDFGEQLLARRDVAHLTLEAFNTGSVETRGAVVSSIKSWRSKVTLDVPAFLLRHSARGLLVFDTGLSPEFSKDPAKAMGRFDHFLVPFEQKPGQDLLSQLRAEGVDPAEVRWVFLSHLHIDHAGNIGAFPNATVVVDKREWETLKAAQARRKDPHLPDPAALEKRLKLRLVDLSTQPAFGAFDHGLDFFGDGSIELVDMSGHTAGSMGLWANLDDGPVLLCGDAAWVLDNFEDLALPIKHAIQFPAQYWRRLYEMRDMVSAVPQLVIFPGHDLTPFKLHPRDDIKLAAFPR